MPYPKPFARISWIFAIHGTEEIAETSCHISTLGTAPFNAAAFVAALLPADGLALAGYMTTMLLATGGARWAQYSDFTAVKVADVDVTGHATASPFIWESPTPYDHGTYATITPQQTVVLSLRSGSTFGVANFGRMYLPHTTFDLSGAEYAGDPTDTSQAVSQGITFIRAVNTLANGKTAGSGVVNISSKGAGTVKGVAQVQVGSIVDTQRRRRNRLQEVYASGTV